MEPTTSGARRVQFENKLASQLGVLMLTLARILCWACLLLFNSRTSNCKQEAICRRRRRDPFMSWPAQAIYSWAAAAYLAACGQLVQANDISSLLLPNSDWFWPKNWLWTRFPSQTLLLLLLLSVVSAFFAENKTTAFCPDPLCIHTLTSLARLLRLACIKRMPICGGNCHVKLQKTVSLQAPFSCRRFCVSMLRIHGRAQRKASLPDIGIHLHRNWPASLQTIHTGQLKLYFISHFRPIVV